MNLNPKYLLYRCSTIARSFKALYCLPPQQVDSFIKSYTIYDCDWVQGQAIKNSQVIDYPEVKENILNWYGVLNHLCAIGEVEKMYIPPALDLTKGIIENQLLFEKKFSQQLEMKAGDKVLELGCGRGRVAAHLASYTGSDITGINIDQGQLDNAIAFANKQGLSNQCHFLNHDFNDLPLPFKDNSFDCAYEIQAISLSKDLEKLFKELYRVLKPSGKFSLLEWVRFPNYNPNDLHHIDLMRRIKPFIGAIGTPSPAELEDFLYKAGFKVLVSEEPSINKHQGPLINKAGRYFDIVSAVIKGLVSLKLFPKHFMVLFDRLRQDGQALREAEQKRLVTTSYHIIAQKNEAL
jgi:sterol 24-C-methyltransferase